MQMSQMLFFTHSGWRHIVIAVLVLVIVKYLIGLLAKSQWSRFDQILGAATPIVVDIQWLLGIVLWLMAPSAWFLGRNAGFAEHFATMTLALIAGHVGWVRVKRSSDAAAKYRNGLIGFVVSGLLVGLGVARITGVM